MDTLAYAKLRTQLEELAHFSSTLALLQWDQEIYMPAKGGEPRAKLISYLSVVAHEKLLALNSGKLLTKLVQEAKKTPNTPEAIVIRDVWRSYTRERKLPTAFVQELAELTSRAQTIWAEARAKSDFSLFLPSLKRLVELKRQEAAYVGYKNSPYDALLDTYEPGLTSAQIDPLFSELRDFLKPFLRKLKAAKQQPPAATRLKGKFPLREQEAFNEQLLRKVGFDFEAGRIDQSTHPFTTNFHPYDVRITTRYSETDALYALGSTIHEMGHALYEQGLPVEHFGTPLAEAVSLGIHESQSRFWENMIGKGRPFWKYFYPKLQKQFPKPYARVPFETFYRILNRVEPAFIRTEADEVTYNLHIIIRYELERGLIEGTLKAKDLPQLWKAKMKDYLGVTVKNDREGVLQDVHWSIGAIGYFPTYTLGNLYAAQFSETAKKQLPKLEAQLEKGNFTPLREWLRTHIHAHGKTFTSEALVKEITGEPLQASYFIKHLKEKYGELYEL